MISFQSSTLQLDLFPDSRGYVLFNLHNIDEQNKSKPLMKNLTSEYLVDLVQVTDAAMRWITENCENITTEDRRHLYFKFRNANVQIQVAHVRGSKQAFLSQVQG